MNLSAVFPMIYAELNATVSDLTFWTQAELYDYADRNLNRLSRRLSLFVDISTIPGTSLQSVYLLAFLGVDTLVATRFVSLIQTAWNGSALAPANTQETEAYDANWETTVAANGKSPESWLGDYLGAGMLALYPAPNADGTITVICQRSAAQVTADASQITAPEALGDWLHMRVLAEARRKRSDAWMPEAADMAEQIGDSLEKAFTTYYGTAE